jgi:hypothetical protein
VRRLALLTLLLGAHCWASDNFVGPCYQVQGRLSYWNGTPSTRIWIVGTHRVLGVPSEDQELPPNVKPLLRGFEDQVFANFTVCPLTKEHAGEMRMVFVKSARRVVDRPKPQE